MKTDKNMLELIARLEYLIGSECYNPNSYNGWTGESGCGFRYPVKYRAKSEEKNLTKTSGTIRFIDSSAVNTMKYTFGSNHLFVGNAIVKILQELEERYHIDFNLLEQDVLNNRLKECQKKDNDVQEGRKVILAEGEYRIGTDIMEGEYIISTDEKAFKHIYHYNAQGGAVEHIMLGFETTESEIHLENEDILRLYDNCLLSKNIDAE